MNTSGVHRWGRRVLVLMGRAFSLSGMSRNGVRALLAIMAALAVFSLSEDAHAYSWMIRHTQWQCSSCHADPSGGETLSPYGRFQSAAKLTMDYGGDAAEDGKAPKSAGFLWGAIAPDDTLLDDGNRILLGGSLRFLTVVKPEEKDVAAFPMQMDLYGEAKFGGFRVGGSLGAGKVEPGSPHVHAAQVTTNQGDELNLISRTHYVGYDVSSEVLIRAGRLNLPFGVRIPEHVMWVREASQTDRESDQQHGVAVAYTGQDFRGEIMGIAGNYQINPDEFRERGYSGYFEYKVADTYALGLSSLFTVAKADRITNLREDTKRGAHGVFARLSPAKPLVLLVEGDVLTRTGRDLGYTGFGQADVEPVQGLHLMLTGEVLNEGIEGVDQRFGGWFSVNWFFLPHMDMRVDAVMRQDSDLQILSQLHAYL
ncbi:MAG: hypothetical protein KC492_05425 [Myxococcales bacterium]|nr:hypothetical protein [Myxococcales bacterium]